MRRRGRRPAGCAGRCGRTPRRPRPWPGSGRSRAPPPTELRPVRSAEANSRSAPSISRPTSGTSRSSGGHAHQGRVVVAVPQRGAVLAVDPPRGVPRGLGARAAPRPVVDEPRSRRPSRTPRRRWRSPRTSSRTGWSPRSRRRPARGRGGTVRRRSGGWPCRRAAGRPSPPGSPGSAPPWRTPCPTDPTGPSRPTIALSVASLGVPSPGLAHHEQLAGDLGAAASERACATVGVTGFSPRTGRPANERGRGHGVVRLGDGHVDDGVGAGCGGPPRRRPCRSRPTARTRRPLPAPPPGPGRRRRRGPPRSTGRSVSSQARPMPPAPTTTRRNGPSARDRPELAAHPADPGSAANSSPVSWRRSAGSARSGRSVTAHSTAFAMTRRTSGWW